MKRVLLIHMPLAVPIIPSLAAHLLASILERSGFPADVFYGTTRLKRTPPLLSYVHGLAGEVIFAPQLYPDASPEEFARRMLECPSGVGELRAGHQMFAKGVVDSAGNRRESESLRWPIPRRRVTAQWPFGTSEDDLLADLLTHMDMASMCIDKCLTDIPDRTYDIFAFSVGFDAQKVASLALAKRLKERDSSARIVFGGTACDGEMGDEMLRRFSFIDVVSQGDGDLTIEPLVSALRGHGELKDVPGIIYREGESIFTTLSAPPLQNLDSLPIPDYTQFLEQLEASDWKDQLPFILFEASRGCWWGEKHHCKFCGLRADGLAYRRKSPQRVREELAILGTKYRDHFLLYATDAILDHRYLKDFFPSVLDLAEQHEWKLFFELKSNLKKEDIALLASANVKSVQPGIESFSDRVLSLMDKGCGGLKQVQILKWLTSYKIEIIYNLIIGTPGETAEDYEETLELVPHLMHFPPPMGVHSLSLDRFSPYFDDPQKYGISEIAPRDAYTVIYPDKSIDLSRLVYKFRHNSPEHQDSQLRDSWTRLSDAVDFWKEEHSRRGLWWSAGPDGVQITEYKDGVFTSHRLRSLASELYRFCDTVRSFKEICKEFPNVQQEVLRACLERWASLGWIFGSRAGSYIGLAIEAEPARRVRPDLVVIERNGAALAVA
jgi:ribosomal peptide maturation radical SAM protein 1